MRDRCSKLCYPNMEVVIQPSANMEAASGRDACIDRRLRPTRDSEVTSSRRRRSEHRVYHFDGIVIVFFPDLGREGRGCLIMHWLLQLCMQSWLAMESKAETYQAEAVEV